MIRRYLSLPSNFSIDISPSSFFFHPTSRLNIERYPLFEGIFHAFHQKNQRSRDEMKALRPGTSQTLIEPRLLLADVFQNPSSFSSSSSFSNEVSINFSSAFEGEFFRGRGGKERDGGNECEIIARNNGTKRAWHKGGPSLAADVYFRQLWELWCRAPLRLHAPIAY